MPTQQYKDAIKITVARFTLKYRDFFNMKGLYEHLHEWVLENGYATRDDEEFNETLMLERIRQQSGKEIWIWWRLEKKPTSFYRYLLNVDYHIVTMTEVEVMHEGKKFKSNKGECELQVSATVVADPEGKWLKHWFLKGIREIFVKRIFRGDLELHQKELYRDAYKMQASVKEFLKLKSFFKEPEVPHRPPLGLGDVS